MRKNIWTLLVLLAFSSYMLTGCSKKAVVPPKQTDRSAANAPKPGNTGSTNTTATNQTSGNGSCGGNGYYNGANSPGH